MADMEGNDNGRQPFPSRPPISSYHSSSLPTTPHQHPRDLRFRSRSPSPNGDLISHSPRSVSSEANGSLTTLRKPRMSLSQRPCKFETAMAFGRRRFQYDLGADPLEKAVEEPKVALNPDEENSLSGDMRELYDRLLPTTESEERRKKLVKKLEDMLYKEWPGYEFKVHVFGSSGNMLCTTYSDVDICIQTSMKELETVHMLAAALDKNGMDRVVCVASAKVPIVKIWDPELKLACDMNVNNILALENTRLIKTYVQIDERVRPLAMIIKYWTQRRILNDAALGGTISSYTWICMILNFLQTRDPPILPALHQLPHRQHFTASGVVSEFADDLEALRGFGKANTETLGQLLFQFFRRYGHEIDYDTSVVSVRQGRLLSRESKKWDLKSLTKEGANRLCVEEPFNTDRNLGNSADPTAFRGIHLELRQAFDVLAQGGRLEEICEQYEYPPEEKVVFKKPTPAPKPVLTRSSSQSSRGGRGSVSSRGGKNNLSQKSSSYGSRRSSSGAPFGNHRIPFAQGPSYGFSQQGHLSGSQLHNELYQRYIALGNLKAELYKQAVAQAHSQSPTANASPQNAPFPVANPQTHERVPATVPIGPGLMYHYPTQFELSQPLSQSLSQEGIRTNPSSPALSTSVPALARTSHRSSIVGGSSTGSIRSQSQPARSINDQRMVRPYLTQPCYEAAAALGYPVPASAQDVFTRPSNAEMGIRPPVMIPVPAAVTEYGSPKEYVGYYVADPSQTRPQYQQFAVPPIPSYADLTQRRRRLSPEMMHPVGAGSTRGASRSPSPLGTHLQGYSTDIPPSHISASPLNDRTDSIQRPVENGLLIVNGSYPVTPCQVRENRAASEPANGLSDQIEGLGLISTELPSRPDQPPRWNDYSTAQQQLHADETVQRNMVTENTPPISTQGTHDRGSSMNSALVSTPQITLPQQVQAPAEPVLQTSSIRSGEARDYQSPLSPMTQHQSPWTPNAYPRSPIPPLDISKSSARQNNEKDPNGIPMLSPVFETRTPSPTANRRLSAIIGTKEEISNGYPEPIKAQEPEEIQKPSPARQTVASKPGPISSQAAKDVPVLSERSNRDYPAAVAQANGWQKTTTKKSRRRAKSGAAKDTGPEDKAGGQPLPPNAADRKGG